MKCLVIRNSSGVYNVYREWHVCIPMNIIWEFSINLMFSHSLLYLHVVFSRFIVFTCRSSTGTSSLIFWCIYFFHYAFLQHFPFSSKREDLSLWVTCYFWVINMKRACQVDFGFLFQFCFCFRYKNFTSLV